MLKGINPILTGELLLLLDRLGHGEQLALVDRNFPAYQYGKPVVELKALNTKEAAEVLLSVFPLDPYVEKPIRRMAFEDDPQAISEATKGLQEVADANTDFEVKQEAIERFAFYDAAQEAALFVMTGETIGYSDYLLRKGVV